MEAFTGTELNVPLLHVAILLAFSTLVLLAGRLRLALLINYLFTLYWGYIANRGLFVGTDLEKLQYFDVCYFGFGLAIVVFASIGFMLRHDRY